METKDWITLGGILLTLGVSVYSLSINIKNRKNAIREHLYKEQIDFFVKLCKEFTELNNLIPSLFTKNEEFHKEVLKQFFEKASMIDELFESHNYIIPNDHYLLISKTMSEVYKILSIEFKKDEIFKREIYENYKKVYSILEDEIREFIGVDYLSEENRKLIGAMKLEISKKK